MTVLSCLGIGIAFAIAVGLLLVAGSLIGLSIPLRLNRRPPTRRRPSDSESEEPSASRPRDV